MRVHTYISLVPGSGPVESVKSRILRTMKSSAWFMTLPSSRNSALSVGENASCTATWGHVPGPQEWFVPYFIGEGPPLAVSSGARPSGFESCITCVNFGSALGWLAGTAAGSANCSQRCRALLEGWEAILGIRVSESAALRCGAWSKDSGQSSR